MVLIGRGQILSQKILPINSLDCCFVGNVLLDFINLFLDDDYFLFDLVPVAHEGVPFLLFDGSCVVVEEAWLPVAVLLHRNHSMHLLLALCWVVNRRLGLPFLRLHLGWIRPR